MFLKNKFNFFLLVLFIIPKTYSVELEKFYLLFKEGKYQKAINILEGKLKKEPEFEATRNYLLGLSYKNMQRHDIAIPYFKKAIKKGIKSEDIFFEYGQSLFAVNELDSARRAFRISFEKKYKPDISLYYLSHIGEIVEDHGATKRNYIKLINDKSAKPSMKQVAYLRLAELVYNRTQNKFFAHNYIVDYVVPLLLKGLALDPKSEIAKEIQLRYDEILLKHDMHPLLLNNGRMLSRQGTSLFFSQEFQFDSNVTLESDAPGISQSDTEQSSLVYFSEFFYSQRFIGGKYFILTPELRLSWTEYGNQENPEVFQNDSFGISPAVRGSYNFKWKNKKAALLYEIEGNYTARDKDQIGERSFFGRSLTYSLGLRRRFVRNGDTTFKFRVRDLKSFSNAVDGPTRSLYVDQLYIRENGHIIVGVFLGDFYRPLEEFNATDSYLFRANYLIPQLYKGFDINFNGALTFLDTKKQSDTRGIERNINLGLKIQKRINNKWRLGLNYSRIQNISDDVENFSYVKSITSFEIRYVFR